MFCSFPIRCCLNARLVFNIKGIDSRVVTLCRPKEEQPKKCIIVKDMYIMYVQYAFTNEYAKMAI